MRICWKMVCVVGERCLFRGSWVVLGLLGPVLSIRLGKSSCFERGKVRDSMRPMDGLICYGIYQEIGVRVFVERTASG